MTDAAALDAVAALLREYTWDGWDPDTFQRIEKLLQQTGRASPTEGEAELIQRAKPKEVSEELQCDLTKALDTLFDPGACVCVDTPSGTIWGYLCFPPPGRPAGLYLWGGHGSPPRGGDATRAPCAVYYVPDGAYTAVWRLVSLTEDKRSDE